MYRFMFMLMVLVPLNQAQSNSGLLTLLFRTNSLQKVKSGNVVIRSGEGQIILNKNVQDGTAINLPYGRYKISFNSTFIHGMDREVTIDKPEALAVFAGQWELMDSPPSTASIGIAMSMPISCTGEKFLWVRLVSLLSQNAFEQVVSRGGTASFEGVEHGTYVALIIDGTRIRGTKSFTTFGPVTSVHFELDSCRNTNE